MNPADFESYYKKASNAELIAVLENQQDYQHQAIESVKKELASRKLSEKEMDGAYDEWHQQQYNTQEASIIQSKLKSKGASILQKINPLDPQLTEEERIIRFVLIWFSLIFLYSFISGFKEIIFYIKHAVYIEESILHLFPYIVLPVSLVLFALRKKAGWCGLTFLLGAIFLISVPSFLQIMLKQNSAFESLLKIDSGLAAIDLLIPIIVLGVTIFALCKPGVRNVFNISRITMKTVGVLSAIAAIFFYFISLYGV